MKKCLLSLFIFTGAIIFSSSCKMNELKGEGPKGTTNPEVSSFSAVDIDLPLKVGIAVQNGSQPGIQISGYNNVIKHLKAEVKNNTLTIYSDLDENWKLDCEDVTVQITMPSINALSLSGAPRADVQGNISGKDFKLEISGASRANLSNISVSNFYSGVSGASKVGIDNMTVDNLSSELSGASYMEVRGGNVNHATYGISGAAKIKAFPLQTTETTASISGAGKGEVSAQQKLTASVSGAAAIKYKGHPALTKDISGAGSVTDAN